MVGPRILIVEDHHVFSEALELLLGKRLREERVGRAEFRRAATVAGGLGLVHEDGPFDVAIVDLTLPDGDGTEVLREIRAAHPLTRVAALGAVSDLSGAQLARAGGTIGKDRPLDEIISRLACLAGVGPDVSTAKGVRHKRHASA